MMAAGTAALKGNKVYLYEKNRILGKKLLITGKGRCNVTNNCDIQTLMDNVVCNGKFLYSSFSAFTPVDTMNFFEINGVQLKTERGQRVFPFSDKSSDIVNALKKYLKDNNVNTVNKKVININAESSSIKGITDETGHFEAFDKVILCTGGLSYPLTGSTGDGYKFAHELGHTVTELKGSLVPLEIKENWCKELQGLTLKNVRILVIKDDKEIFSEFGEMIFTHFGVSGPVILSASSHINHFEKDKYKVFIDLKPALTDDVLDARILRDFAKYINKDIKNALNELLPKAIIPVIISICGFLPDLKVNSITKEMRQKLTKNIKNLELNIKAFRPIEEAIITRGGIKVEEINPKNIESKLVKNLFFAGEIIDVDAYTGGFNLQIAFSTGYLAGNSV